MKFFDVFDVVFDKKVYDFRMVEEFFSRIKKYFVVINGGYKFRVVLDLSDWVYKDLSKIKEWLGGDLVEVGDFVFCDENKNLESLGGCGLKRIKGGLVISGSNINNLGDLEYLGGEFYCDDDKVEYFRNSRWGKVLHLR